VDYQQISATAAAPEGDLFRPPLESQCLVTGEFTGRIFLTEDVYGVAPFFFNLHIERLIESTDRYNNALAVFGLYVLSDLIFHLLFLSRSSENILWRIIAHSKIVAAARLPFALQPEYSLALGSAFIQSGMLSRLRARGIPIR